MKRFTILTTLIFFLLLIVIPGMAQQEEGKPKMVIEQPVFNAGDVYRTKDKIEHAFIIKNTGTAELKILSAKPG